MVFVYLVHVTHVLRGSQSSKFMIMFYHAREADTESKYSRNPAARAKKSPENAVSAFRHESVHRVLYNIIIILSVHNFSIDLKEREKQYKRSKTFSKDQITLA